MTRILIVDNNPVFRRGLKDILKEEIKSVEFGEAHTVHEALDLIWKRPWDIVLLDFCLSGRSGLEALHDIKKEKPRLPVLILSLYPEEQYAVRAFKAGASAYLTKESAPEEIAAAVRAALAGHRYVNATLGEKLAATLEDGVEQPLHEKLSGREFEVLRLIASGKKVTEIAHEWSVSPTTVSAYRMRMMLKMGMKTNSELTTYAVRQNMFF